MTTIDDAQNSQLIKIATTPTGEQQSGAPEENKIKNVFEGQNTSNENTSNGVGYDNPNSWKHIWAEMSRSDLERVTDEKLKARLTDEFNKADIGTGESPQSDGVITQEEYAIFHNKYEIWKERVKEDAQGKSGERVLEGGKYTVKEGDTIIDIAKDFGVSPLEIVQKNWKVIGRNISSISAGTVLSFDDVKIEEKEKIKTDTKIIKLLQSGKKEDKIEAFKLRNKPTGKAQIFAGMTYEQAEKIGGETFDTYLKYCPGGGVLTDKQFAEYQKTLIPTKQKELMMFVKDIIGEEFDAQDIKFIAENMLPKEVDTKNHSPASKTISKNITELTKEYLNRTDGDMNELSREYYEELQNMVEADKKSDNGVYRYHLDRLKKGKFSNFEKDVLGLKGELTDEQAAKYAEKAMKAEYIVPVIKALGEAVDGKNDEKIMLLITNIGTEFFNNPDVQALVEAYGLTGIINELNRRNTANHIAENSKLNLDDMNEMSAGIYTAVLAQNADAQSFEVFVQNHSQSIDFIKEIADVVINKLPEGEQKSALQSVMNKVSETITGTPATKAEGQPDSSAAGYFQNQVNKPEKNPYMSTSFETEQTAFLKEASSNMYRHVEQSKDVMQQLKLEELAEEINKHKKMGVKIRELKNKSIGAALSEMFAHYDEMPDTIKLKFKSHMQAMPNNRLCEAYIGGNDQLRNFMTNMQYVNKNMLYEYFDSNPVSLVKAPLRMQKEYFDKKNKEMFEDYINNNDSKKNRDNWHRYYESKLT